MTYEDIVRTWESFIAWHGDNSLPCTREEFESLDLTDRTLKVFSGEWL